MRSLGSIQWRCAILRLSGLALAIPLSLLPVDATGAAQEHYAITKPVEASKVGVKTAPATRSYVFEEAADVSDLIFLEAPEPEEFEGLDPDPVEKGALRIGILRDLPQVYEVSQRAGARWSAMRDASKVWAVMVQSENAEGIRIHLEDVQLPKGATLIAVSVSNPDEWVGPYTEKDLLASGDGFWTGTIFSEAAVLECRVPAHVDEDSVSFDITRIAHMNVPLSDLNPIAKVGNCHNDVTCADANWRNAGNGVAGIGSIGDAGFLWCTGTLLNNTANDFINYFLTAHHCVRNQSEASSTEYYWFYQTSTCNGSAPNPASVPRTGGGADFLAGKSRSAGSDFALLRIRNATPGGVTYVGWSTTHPGISSSIRGIHHPDGHYKRISNGSITAQPGNYWRVVWSSGVTEPGSSGSPLFNMSRQVIGQLWGGSSSCRNQSSPDEYGRFDISYPFISQWLDPSSSPGPGNDDFANATAIAGGSGQVNGSNIGATKQAGEPNHAGNSGGRSVWWRWTAPVTGQVTVDTFGSNYDTLLAVYTGGSVGGLSPVAANDDAGGGLQSRVTFNGVSGTVYRIAVDGYNGASGNITLKWSQAGGGGGSSSSTKINSGGNNTTGGWEKDRGFTGKSAKRSVSRTIQNAGDVPQPVWRTIRVMRTGGRVTYNLSDVAPGNYLVRLYFADFYSRRSGTIRFHIDIEGVRVQSNFDVFSAAGGRDRAIIREFQVSVNGNGLQIRLTPTKNAAFVNGIEIVPAGSSRERVQPEPAHVWASGNRDDARRAVDGDDATAWVGDAGAPRWWMALVYDRVIRVSDVRVLYDENSVTRSAFLGSRDGRTWFNLGAALDSGPADIRYLWIYFLPDNGEDGRVPRIREIEIE